MAMDSIIDTALLMARDLMAMLRDLWTTLLDLLAPLSGLLASLSGLLAPLKGNWPLAGAGVLVFMLVLILISAIRRRRKNRMEDNTFMSALEIDDLALEIDEAVANKQADKIDMNMLPDRVAKEIKNDDANESFIVETLKADAIDNSLMPHFDKAYDTTLDDLDDITIPRVGDAPSPSAKSELFSAPWLHRADKNVSLKEGLVDEGQMPDARGFDTPANVETRKSLEECARLADIERKMLALRELYEAGLIAPEIYVLKAREFAAQGR